MMNKRAKFHVDIPSGYILKIQSCERDWTSETANFVYNFVGNLNKRATSVAHLANFNGSICQNEMPELKKQIMLCCCFVLL